MTTSNVAPCGKSGSSEALHEVARGRAGLAFFLRVRTELKVVDAIVDTSTDDS